MALLSSKAQSEVDRAKDGIEDLQECSGNLDGFSNGLVLWTSEKEFHKLGHLIDAHVAAITEVIEGYLGKDSRETNLLLARIQLRKVPSNLDQDGLVKALRQNIVKAQEALKDAVDLLEEKIARIKSETTAAPSAKDAPIKKDPVVVLKPTLWGMSIDLGELWRRWRGR
ncbi:hypothetical protein EDE08_101655 [Bradyrhizobium sp. R2.2-H]|jgi:hypothetical protein|uniref:hypothetical protein n=1 Tax=unclassified Bradyrhizobium TaxID=2631580 RepID=UPI001042C965|nr:MULTISPECIES: hypothetical protein [unclassified Bradyrhizobium]TCU78873.1 hypothetical protein EDE10_101656 [Bradyrhizobium sp. Y-H1]TCU80956.1 hypothetical protein EDE08_101655 [Bradyrhizobium sp. R2.2-H]